MKQQALCVLAGLALLPAATAMAQWSDNFDSYATGSQLHGQGGWKGWDNAAAQGALTSSTQSISAPNSAAITAGPGGAYGSDLVHEYSGYSSGQWRYQASLFIPTNTTGTNTYFILMNKYVDLNPGNVDRWSFELQFNLTTNVAYDDLLGTGGGPSPGSASVPIVRNAWIPIRVDIDLSANTFTSFYNGAPVISGAWTRGQAGATSTIGCVDLYGGDASNVYYDDLSLSQIPSPAGAMVLGLGGLLLARRRRA